MSGIRLVLLITRRLYGLSGGIVQPSVSLRYQDQCCGKRRCLVVLGPGWADRLSKVCDSTLDSARSTPECRLRSLVELSLPDCSDGDLQILASLANGVAEEFAFCGVNERVRSENF